MAKTQTPNDEFGKPLQYDPNFRGPLKNRSCTDILCLLLFIAFIGAWIGIGIYAIRSGDVETLLIPRDSDGNRCGFDSKVQNKPYLWFFDLTKCIGATVFTGCNTPQVCVERCPNDAFYFLENDPDWEKILCKDGKRPNNPSEAKKMIQDGICAQWYLKSKSILKRCVYNIGDRKSLGVYSNGDEVQLMKNQLKTLTEWISVFVHYGIAFFNVINRCIPNIADIPPNFSDKITDIAEKIKEVDFILKAEKIGQDVVDDIKNSWKEILAGIAIAIVICIIYIAMLRWIASVMVWLSILGSIALMAFCVYLTSKNYKYYKNHPDEYESAKNVFDSYLQMKETWLGLLIVSSVILGVILLILIFLRKRIYLAIALIEEASKAVSATTASLFFPIFPWILQISVIIWVIAVAAYLSTIGNPLYKVTGLDSKDCVCSNEAAQYTNGVECNPDIFNRYCHNPSTSGVCETANCHFTKIVNPKLTKYLHGYNLFGLFWGLFFVSAFGEMVLAATFATWYWTIPKSRVPFFTVTAAILRTMRYHIGTLAFGSLIIAICRMIRVILEYIDHKLKKYDNEITKAILCCLKCFFWCLEKFLKFINKNAYIMCAIHGKNFCLSAKDAFSLLMRNILRVFVLDKVTDFLFFLSKILVTIGASAICYTIIVYTSKDQFTYYFVPVIFVAVGSYLVTTVFFGVCTMAVDTLFLCYLEDCERNDGSQEKPYFMSKNLMKIFNKKNKTH